MKQSQCLWLAAIALTIAMLGHSGAAIAGDEQQCSSLACTGNSPKVLSHELNPLRITPGVVSDSGFTTAGIELDGGTWDLAVQGGELFAVTATETRTGAQLEGAEIVVFYQGDEYRLAVIDYKQVEYWTRTGEYTHLYRLEWRTIVNNETGRAGDVCEHPLPRDGLNWGNNQHYSFFIAGERYNIPSVAVEETGGAASDMLYVACAGSALAKAEMNSYSPNIPPQQGNDWSTSPDDREILLRAYTAGYGYGALAAMGDHLERFTVPGEPLLIEDPQGWMTVDPEQARAVEAVWGPSGLVCLEEPRRLVEEPDIMDAITPVIPGVPTCSTLHPDIVVIDSDAWRAYGSLRTLLPYE
ncbi:MAG: hypothetical protein Tsb0020_36640 [Haliangiales bacterium]